MHWLHIYSFDNPFQIYMHTLKNWFLTIGMISFCGQGKFKHNYKLVVCRCESLAMYLVLTPVVTYTNAIRYVTHLRCQLSSTVVM